MTDRRAFPRLYVKQARYYLARLLDQLDHVQLHLDSHSRPRLPSLESLRAAAKALRHGRDRRGHLRESAAANLRGLNRALARLTKDDLR